MWSNFALGTVLLMCLTASDHAMAGSLTVRVVDRNGMPVSDVVVFVEQAGTQSVPDPVAKTAVMDQVNERFVPHILVIQKGTSVEFPNSDVVAHHVYSFSKPNDFVLPLYKGDSPEPVTFVKDGVAVLGCNIHDQMLSYIVVVDTPVFGKTAANGAVELQVDDAATELAVRIWNPRIRDSEASLVQHVAPEPGQELEFSLLKKLRPQHDDHKEAIEWADY